MPRMLLTCLALAACASAFGQTPAPAAPDVAFPFDLGIIDPNSADKLPPYIVMFEDGLDENGKDVKGPLGRLEAFRGASKMFPETNKNPGLPVVLRGLRFHRLLRRDNTLAGFELELQGEYNSIKVPLSEEEMKKFLAGERVMLSLKGEANFGVYSYVSTVKMDVQFTAGALWIYGIEGDFSFREGFRTYTSKTKKLTPPGGRKHLYRGEPADLPALPTI